MSIPAWQFEHSVQCPAERSFVWAFWTDVANWERIEGEAVEWNRLEGPFAVGTRGGTKAPGQEPRSWAITQLEPQRSATIEMQLDGAIFANRIVFESLSEHRTRFAQRMTLDGPRVAELADGIRVFETTAPAGLARLASGIEEAWKAGGKSPE